MTEDAGEPEERPRRGVSVLPILLGCAFVTVGVLATVGPWFVRARDTRISTSCARTMGAITAVSPSLEAGGDGEHTVTYVFDPGGGEPVRATRSVSEESWKAASVGATIAVDFDPDRPADNFPTGSGQTSLGVPLFVSV